MKIILAILALMRISGVSYAGDIVSAGETVKEDSYVFTIEEAERLQERLFELEKKEQILIQYETLSSLQEDKIELFLENETIYKERISNLNTIIDELEEINARNIKNQRWNRVENSLIVATTVATTISMFILVDYINDKAI